MGIIVDAGTNYGASEGVLTAENWTFKIEKADLTATDFTCNIPVDLIYNGTAKNADVKFNTQGDKLGGIGNFTVKYYFDADCTAEADPVNAGTYYVGITVEEGDNYKAPSTVLHSNDWNFEITKATAQVSDFIFAPPTDLTDDGNAKTATVKPKSGLYGMGEVTVKYYADADRTNEIQAPDVKTVGTYYVGITVEEGGNYKATETNPVLYDNDWSFSIDAATPSIALEQGWTYNGEMKQLIGIVTYNGATDLYLCVVKEEDESPAVWVKYENEESLVQDAFKRADAGRYHVLYYVGKTAPAINDRGTQVDGFVEIGKADITPTVRIANWTYGQTASTPSVTGNAGDGTVTYEYKQKNANDDAYSTSKPSTAGEYTVRATIAETGNYNGASVTENFTIAQADPIANVPTGLTATYGDKLSDVTLTNPQGNTDGTWSCVPDGETSVGNAGSNRGSVSSPILLSGDTSALLHL